MRRDHFLRSATVAMVLGLLAGTPEPVSAKDILLYGAPVKKGDFVAGTVRFIESREVAIDLGYVDGVVPGHRFRVYRRVGRDYRLSGIAIVGLVQRRQSMVTAKTRVPIRVGDAVVIAAADLAIWAEPRNRLDDEGLRRRVARPRQLGYDTRQTEIDAIDLVETRRRNKLKLLEWTRRVREGRPQTTVLWDLTQLKIRRQDFLDKLEAFGNSFRYRTREDRESGSFTTVVQPISPQVPIAGQPYEASPTVTAAPGTKKSVTEPPKRVPRVRPLSTRVSQYLGRGNTQ